MKSLLDLTNLLHGLKELRPSTDLPRVQSHRVNRDDMKAFDENRFEWLVQGGYLWTVRMEQKNNFDHTTVMYWLNRVI